MMPVNKPKKRRRHKKKKQSVRVLSPRARMVAAASMDWGADKVHELSALHEACACGDLESIQLLVKSKILPINGRDSQGRCPIHVVLAPLSFNADACLEYLIKHDADVNVTTSLGHTPLHIAASKGMLNAVQTLVEAGSNVLAQDNMGYTPLELARIWCQRKVARYLKNCEWHTHKDNEMEERKSAFMLYKNLVCAAKKEVTDNKVYIDQRVAEWAARKGLTLLKFPTKRDSIYHTTCIYSHEYYLDKIRELSFPSLPNPWTIFMGMQADKLLEDPDLRNCVLVFWNTITSELRYITKWQKQSHPAPKLQQELLERVLFPRSFPSRLPKRRPLRIDEVKHRRPRPGKTACPWTEVALHLTQVLLPGHLLLLNADCVDKLTRIHRDLECYLRTPQRGEK